MCGHTEDDIEQVEDVPAKSTPRSDEEEDEEENDEEDDYDYDSDETGEMETESDDDTNPPEAVELIKGEISKWFPASADTCLHYVLWICNSWGLLTCLIHLVCVENVRLVPSLCSRKQGLVLGIS